MTVTIAPRVSQPRRQERGRLVLTEVSGSCVYRTTLATSTIREALPQSELTRLAHPFCSLLLLGVLFISHRLQECASSDRVDPVGLRQYPLAPSF
jgi:hypothetical protein